MMDRIFNFIAENKATFAVAGGWLIHTFWPELKAFVTQAFPWLKANGGIVGVCKVIFVGEKTGAISTAEKLASTEAQTKDINL